MKFKIHKETVVTKTNIFGKPIERETICYIYRPIFFGLLNRFLSFIPNRDWVGDQIVVKCWHVYYELKKDTSKFSEQEAETLLKNIYSQPDKFIRKP
jgi:hypothetical protein